MAGRVDQILDGWFGEPLEHSENEDQLSRHLYQPLRRIEAELDQLRSRLAWLEEPDRSGGQFTQDEITSAEARR